MRIALDASLLGARFSGVERSVAQLLRHLPLLAAAQPGGGSYEFLVYVGRHFGDYVAAFHPDGLDPTGRLQIIDSGVDNRLRGSRIWWQQVVLPRLVHNAGADVFHGPAYIVSPLMRSPHVVTLYDLISIDQPQFATRSNQLYYRTLLRAGAARAQRVIVPSADTRRAVARLIPSAYERTVTIPLGVDSRFFAARADDAAVREPYRLPERYYLWVGNVEPKKNVGILLDALVRLRERGQSVPRLVLAGELSWGSNALMQKFVERGLHHHVTVLGPVPDAHLPALYRGATAFLFPSLAEGFGLPVLEAMASGVPVAASTAGALPEVVDTAGLTVPPDDADAWADAMVRLVEDGALRERLIADGHDRARGFTWDRTAAATLATYQQAAAVGEDEYDHTTGRLLYQGE